MVAGNHLKGAVNRSGDSAPSASCRGEFFPWHLLESLIFVNAAEANLIPFGFTMLATTGGRRLTNPAPALWGGTRRGFPIVQSRILWPSADLAAVVELRRSPGR